MAHWRYAQARALERSPASSRGQLAKRCGITASALSKIEHDINNPSGFVIGRIADVLRVPVEHLLDERHRYPYKQPERVVIERPGEKVTMEVTREEELFLRALRRCPARVRRLAYALPYAGPEQSWLLWTVAVAKRKLAEEFS